MQIWKFVTFFASNTETVGSSFKCVWATKCVVFCEILKKEKFVQICYYFCFFPKFGPAHSVSVSYTFNGAHCVFHIILFPILLQFVVVQHCVCMRCASCGWIGFNVCEWNSFHCIYVFLSFSLLSALYFLNTMWSRLPKWTFKSSTKREDHLKS